MGETVEKDGKVTKAFVIGKTRSYFRMGALEYLEAHRTKALGDQALEIQRYLRGWLIRKETMQAVVKRRKNAIKIQRWYQDAKDLIDNKEAARAAKREKVEKLEREKKARQKAEAKAKAAREARRAKEKKEREEREAALRKAEEERERKEREAKANRERKEKESREKFERTRIR